MKPRVADRLSNSLRFIWNLLSSFVLIDVHVGEPMPVVVGRNLGAWRGKKYNGSGMADSGATVIGALHGSRLMPRGDGSNDKRASFSANQNR
jgi:hypothetical protein